MIAPAWASPDWLTRVPVSDAENTAFAVPVDSRATCSTTGTASPSNSSDDGSNGRAIRVDSRRYNRYPDA